MAEEQVTAPDQHRPANLRWIRIGGVLAIIALLLMTRPFNNHVNAGDDVFLVVTAGFIAALLVIDAVLRRSGLRQEPSPPPDTHDRLLQRATGPRATE